MLEALLPWLEHEQAHRPATRAVESHQVSDEKGKDWQGSLSGALDELRVAEKLEALRHEVETLLGGAEQAGDPPAEAAIEAAGADLVERLGTLGRRVEGAGDVLAELSDLLEAQAERLESLEARLGDTGNEPDPALDDELDACRSRLEELEQHLNSLSLTDLENSVDAARDADTPGDDSSDVTASASAAMGEPGPEAAPDVGSGEESAAAAPAPGKKTTRRRKATEAEGAIVGMRADIAELGGKMASVEASLTELRAIAARAVSGDAGAQGPLGVLAGQVVSYGTRMAEIERSLADTQARASLEETVNRRLSEVGLSVAAIGGRLDGIVGSVDRLGGEISRVGERAAEASGKVDGFAVGLVDLRERIREAGERAGAAFARAESVERAVTALPSSTGGFGSQPDPRIEEMTRALSGLESVASTAERRAAEAAERVESVGAEIEGVSERADAAERRGVKLAARLSGVVGEIDQVRTEVGTAVVRADEALEGLGRVEGDVSELFVRTDDGRRRLGEVETRAAEAVELVGDARGQAEASATVATRAEQAAARSVAIARRAEGAAGQAGDVSERALDKARRLEGDLEGMRLRTAEVARSVERAGRTTEELSAAVHGAGRLHTLPSGLRFRRSSTATSDTALSVMIVDGDQARRASTALTLSRAGARTITAADGRECLDLLRRHRADVVLMDERSVEREGALVCKTLQDDSAYADKRDIPLVAHGESVSPSDSSAKVEEADGVSIRPAGYVSSKSEARELLDALTGFRRR